jgi:hypothetical protein
MTATALPRERTSEVRDVPPFERVELRDPTNWVDLLVQPGKRQIVVVEGPAEMLARVRTRVEDRTLRITLEGSVADHVRDAFTTSLTRQRLVYRIHAPRLLEVRVAGLVRVTVHAFGADAPVVTELEPHVPVMPEPPR